MFFYNNQNFQQNNTNLVGTGTRYNLDMLTNIRKRKINPNQKFNNKQLEKINKIKSIKLIEPKHNIKWNEDFFEQIKIEEQKNKIKELKLLEPKIKDLNDCDIKINKYNNDTYEINDWNDDYCDWLEIENNICV
jgi:hypothetical protein